MDTKPIIKNFLTRTAMTLLVLLMTAATAWADEWDETTKTLTVTSDVVSAAAYRGNTEIEHVVIGSSVVTVGMYAFLDCSNLQSVTYEEGSQLTRILDGAFARCTSLTSFTIPARVTYFSSGEVFIGCTNLTTIVVDEGNPNYKSEDGLLLTKDGTTLLFCPYNRAAGHCTIPNGISIIDVVAFATCTTLTDITLPASVTTIKGNAFYGCSNLQTVTFAEGSQLETIAAFAFKECSSLTTFNFAENTPLTSIWTQAFSGCTSLESIALPDHVVEIRERAFEGCTSLTTIHIPASLTTIQRYAFLGCTSLTTFTVDDASETFASDDGVLTNKEGTSLVCYPIGRTAKSYTVPEGMTIIAPYTFQDCTALENVILPEGLTVIDDYAFDGCTSLKEIIIPSSVVAIYSAAFRSCTSLENILIMSNGYRTDASVDAFEGISSECHFYVRSAAYRTKEAYSTFNDRMTVISAVGTTYGAIATPSGEPFITYGGTDYYVTGSTFAISRGAVPDVSTGYMQPFLSYVVRDGSGSDISESALIGETLTLPESDVTVMARYTPIVYSITYDLDGGTADPANPTTFTVESDDITLTTPERFGSIFTGWTGTGLTEAAMSVSILSGSTGNREYTATWVYPTYVDADGIEHECTVAKRISNPGVNPVFDDESVEEAWYYFDGDEEFYGTFCFKAKKTHLILYDGARLTIWARDVGLVADELSIYGQGQSTGILYVDQPLGYNHTFMGIFANNLTINGGKVYAFGMSESDATSAEGLAVLATADININGGLFQALTNLFEKGIYANGNITLGWRLPTDAITVRGYRFGGDLIVKPGQSFINATGDILTGSLIGKASSMFDGRTLSPCYAVNFDANGGNFSGETSVLCATQFDSNGDAHVSAPATDPTRDGYTFGGWKLGEDDFDFTAAVTSNLTLKAYWTGTTNVTFAKEGYGTYYNSSEDVVLPAGMKAYIVTASSDGGSLTYEVIADGDQTDAATAVVPKATAVMLQTAASTSTQSKDVTLASPTDTRDFSDASGNADGWVNMLHGSDAAVETTGGDKYYKLTYNRDGSEKVLGWYWGGDEGAAFGSAAHKAWLALPESASFARGFFGLPGDGETTGICPAEIKEMAERAGVWYSLDGRKLDGKPSAKGVYIVNGKKVVIKDSRSAFTKCND